MSRAWVVCIAVVTLSLASIVWLARLDACRAVGGRYMRSERGYDCVIPPAIATTRPQETP